MWNLWSYSSTDGGSKTHLPTNESANRCPEQSAHICTNKGTIGSTDIVSD